MRNHIRPPVKVDRHERVIVGPEKAYRWRLNVPASITGTTKQRLFFRTEKQAKQHREALLSNRLGLSGRSIFFVRRLSQ